MICLYVTLVRKAVRVSRLSVCEYIYIKMYVYIKLCILSVLQANNK